MEKLPTRIAGEADRVENHDGRAASDQTAAQIWKVASVPRLNREHLFDLFSFVVGIADCSRGGSSSSKHPKDGRVPSSTS